MNAANDRLVFEAANKLAKWRSVYAGWRLGTRAKSDGESQYTRDLHEQLLLLRAEVSALTWLVRDLGATHEQVQERMLTEYTELDKLQEQKFPGFRTEQGGVHMQFPDAADTMRSKGFPQ